MFNLQGFTYIEVNSRLPLGCVDRYIPLSLMRRTQEITRFKHARRTVEHFRDSSTYNIYDYSQNQ